MTAKQVKKVKKAKGDHLSTYIFASIIAALGFALLLPQYAVKLHLGGEIFLSLLKVVVVPLVLTSVMSGVLGLGDIRKLGKPGLFVVLYYLSTTVIAVVMGLVLVNLLQPGVGAVDLSSADQLMQKSALPEGAEDQSVGGLFKRLVLLLFTDNLLKSMHETELLPLIVFAIVFAAVLTTLGSKTKDLTALITQTNEALMAVVLFLMKIAPVGIFCLVTARFGKAQLEGQFLEQLGQTGGFIVTVVLGLAIHGFVILPLFYYAFRRENPYVYVKHMSQALLTAFSTASSSATLPITLECAQKKAKISKRATEFVLPLGATINMDGTALYEAVAVLFIAQVLGLDLSMQQQIIVAITATLAAIGAAGIPEAGLVTMIIVLAAVGLPSEGIGLILAVDWLLDRFRTAVNVFGDAVGGALAEKWLK